MTVYTDGHGYQYETEKIIRIFYPEEKIYFASSGEEAEGDVLFTAVAGKGENTVFSCRAEIGGKTAEYSFTAFLPEDDVSSDGEKLLAKAIIKVLGEITGIVPPWGILTGVRPSKLMRKYIAEKGSEEAKNTFTGFLSVSPEKTGLAFNVAEAENACIALSAPRSYSLYISIPFCPTRCSYCSFVSHSIEQAKKLIPDYVRLLCEEISLTAKTAKELGLRLETVYIGGGTPTSLSAGELERICAALNGSFDMKSVREFTVEAGRPDTVDSEKLTVLKNAGVSRISINPQTFSDKVLENIGRKHTSADIYEKFALARAAGFDNINMDLIAGLPGDSPAGFRDSLDRTLALDPENVTVHTLALKSSARLVTGEETRTVCRETEEMLAYSRGRLYGAGFFPYYMYRQSKSVGNLENVGWAKKGTECLYNIFMMEEVHTVLAAGGGAVTKLKAPGENRIERIYNFKYPYEYISRFDELCERKNAIKEFYGGISY